MAVDTNAFDAWIKGDRPKDKEAADKYFAEREAKINAAPVENELPQQPELNLEQPKLSDNAESEQNTPVNQPNDMEVGDSFFKQFSEKAWPKLDNNKTDNRSDEQIIEDYVESNPEEAKVVLDAADNKAAADLKKEADQVNDGDKRTDEVRNDVVEQFIEEEPQLADTIVSEAADDNSVIDNDKSIIIDNNNVEEYEGDVWEPEEIEDKRDTIVDTFDNAKVDNDYFAEFAKNADEEERERKNKYVSFDPNAPLEERISFWPEEDQKYLKAADKMGLLKEWETRIGGSRYHDKDGNLRFVAGTPTPATNYDKAIKEYKKVLDSIPDYYTVPSDLTNEDLKVAARQAKKKTRQQYGFTKEDARNELDYRAGKGDILDTKPQPRWDANRIQEYQSALNKQANLINPNDPNSIKVLGTLQNKRRLLLEAIKQQKYYATYYDAETEDIQVDPKGQIEVVRPIDEELLETAVDPNEAAMELMKQEAKEKKAEKKRFDEFVKQQSKEIKKRYSDEPATDPEETKKLNDADKQLAIYNPKAIMKVEEELKETDAVLEEKEEKIRKKWGLPKLWDYKGRQLEGANPQGFTQKPSEPIEELKGNASRLSNKAGPLPSGNRSAAVNSNGATSNGLNKRLEADAAKTSPVKSTGPKPMTEQIEQPATSSSKGNSNVNRPSGTIGSLVGWSSVSNKGGGRFAANKGKAPRFSGSSNSGQSGSKLSAKKQADARNITKKEVAQKILSASRQWQINERGEKDSGADLLPVRLYVKDDKIEVSIVGTGRKRKSLDSVNDQELALIDKQL